MRFGARHARPRPSTVLERRCFLPPPGSVSLSHKSCLSLPFPRSGTPRRRRPRRHSHPSCRSMSQQLRSAGSLGTQRTSAPRPQYGAGPLHKTHSTRQLLDHGFRRRCTGDELVRPAPRLPLLLPSARRSAARLAPVPSADAYPRLSTPARRRSTRCGAWTGARFARFSHASRFRCRCASVGRVVRRATRPAPVLRSHTLTLLRSAAATDGANACGAYRCVQQLAQQVVNLGMILSSALIIWKSLILFTASESPVVVVLRFVRALPSTQPASIPARSARARTFGEHPTPLSPALRCAACVQR